MTGREDAITEDRTGAVGLEPTTRCLEGSYSIHLSYAPSL